MKQSNGVVRTLLAGLSLLLLTLTGCTFWVQTSGGQVVQTTLSDHSVSQFVDQTDYESNRLLQETERLGDVGLRQVMVEFREVYVSMTRSMGNSISNPVRFEPLRLKLKAFGMQLDRRIQSPLMKQRYAQVIYWYHQLEQTVDGFTLQIQRSLR